jgi:hypothetical protein
MKALIAAKQAGQEVAEVPHAKMAPVIDLMEALKKSIAEKSQPGPRSPRSGQFRQRPRGKSGRLRRENARLGSLKKRQDCAKLKSPLPFEAQDKQKAGATK